MVGMHPFNTVDTHLTCLPSYTEFGVRESLQNATNIGPTSAHTKHRSPVDDFNISRCVYSLSQKVCHLLMPLDYIQMNSCNDSIINMSLQRHKHVTKPFCFALVLYFLTAF